MIFAIFSFFFALMPLDCRCCRCFELYFDAVAYDYAARLCLFDADDAAFLRRFFVTPLPLPL